MKFILLASTLLLATSAQAEVRAVFVGIDNYAYGSVQPPTLAFANLSGAVADTRRIRDALARSHGLAVGAMPEGDNCQSQGPAALTLINQCATKAAMLAAWEDMLAKSQPGDTLLLYFAGHGSRFHDDTAEQASRYNSTLMAHDARRPGAPAGADILDYETRRFIDRATSNGVNIVTWFDSCNSGTASRDASGNSASRTAPDLQVPGGLEPIASPQQYGKDNAYRVHLGAAGDGQDAKEVGTVGARAGVFTTALAKAILAAPQASFADIAARVVADVTTATQGRQLPHAEGALRATLGGPEIKVATFDVAMDNGQLVMAAGGLVGITPGSRFALFATTGSALVGSSELSARVTDVQPAYATLTPDAPLPPGTPGKLVAREIAHEFGGPAIVQRLNFVKLDARGRFALRPNGNGLALTGPEGLLAELPSSSSPRFGERLAATLEKIARVEQWLATVQPRDGVSLCVRNIAPDEFYDAAQCPPPPAGGRRLKMGKPIMVSAVNRADGPRFVTVLAIGRKYSVTQVLPGFGAKEPAIARRQPVRIPEGQDLKPEETGPLRFVALSSDQLLNATVLEQTDTDVTDGQACLSPVARAFCQGADRARAGNWALVGEWSMAVVNTMVEPAEVP
jgi:hypothetical protein